MSILKQVLNDAWTSVVRKSGSEHVVDRTDVGPLSKDRVIQAVHPAAKVGVKTVILNWKSGENDPFTVINKTVRQHFEACGKNVEVIEITEKDWPTQVARTGTIEFAFTWQGLGSAVKVPHDG